MNIKGNIKYLLAGTIIFLAVYLFLAAVPVGPDFYLEPSWVHTIPTEEENPDNNEEPFVLPQDAEPFTLGNYFGYFTPDGSIPFSASTEDRIAVSPLGWAVYPHNAKQTTITFANGTPELILTEPGYVHLSRDRIYLFHPGGNSISNYSVDGQQRWTRAHTAPITACNTSASGTVLGYADGNLTAMDPDGNVLFSFWPGGSDHQVILGAAMSEDGNLIACISGIDRQRFIITQRMSNQYRILHHQYLDGNLRRTAYINFERSGRFVFFETANGLGIFDSASQTSRILPVSGRVLATGGCPSNTVFVVLTQNGREFTLSAIEQPDHLVATAQFTGDNAFLLQRGTIVYLGVDDRISRIDIRGFE